MSFRRRIPARNGVIDFNREVRERLRATGPSIPNTGVGETLLDAVRTRMAELGYAISPLRTSEVVDRFGRTPPPAGGLHVLVTRAGAPIAYSLWQIADYETDALLDADLQRMRAAGRLIVHMVDRFDRETLRSEMLAAPDLACTRIAMVERAMCATLCQMWPPPARQLLDDVPAEALS